MTPFYPISLVLYAASGALYLAQVVAGSGGPVLDAATRNGELLGGAARAGSWLPRAARLVLAAAFLFHALDIGVHCTHGEHPVANVSEALSFAAWIIVGAYLGTSMRYPLPFAGALIVPVALVLSLAARIGPARDMHPHTATALATLHIVLATAGVALFAVGAGDAIVYLLAERRLKRHRSMLPGVPPLETLDRLNRRSIQLGFPMFTVAMVTGAIWLVRLPNGGAHRLLQPQYAMSVLAWVLYAALLVARVVAGWRGKKAAQLTLGGFAASLCVLVIYYVRGFFGGA